MLAYYAELFMSICFEQKFHMSYSLTAYKK